MDAKKIIPIIAEVAVAAITLIEAVKGKDSDDNGSQKALKQGKK